MDRNPIGKKWSRLFEVVGSLRRKLRTGDRHSDDGFARNPVDGDGYDELRIRPYTPESQRVRSESSLHLGC